jgi:hypothetical protein
VITVETAVRRFQDLSPQLLRAFAPAACIETTRFLIEVFARLGIQAEAVSGKWWVLCPELNLAYCSGLTRQERRIERRRAATWIERKASSGSGYNGHVVAIVAGRNWVDCTLAQASAPEKGLIIEPYALVAPLPANPPPVRWMRIHAGATVGDRQIEITWQATGDRSFMRTEAWDPSHLLEAADQVAECIRSGAQ